MTRGKRTRIATGVYRDRSGYAVVTKVFGVQFERRYTLDSDPDNLRLIRANWIVERKKQEKPEPSTPFWDAALGYLKTIPEGTKRHANAYNDLHCWRQAFHGRNVRAITSALIQQQLASWQPDFQPSTLNKRRQELKNLFDHLRWADHPIKAVPKLKERYDTPRAVLPAVVEAVFAEMTENQTKILCRAIYETSLAPIDLQRISQAHFAPRLKTVYVPERQKGAGAPAVTMTLTTAGVQALQAFFGAGLEGKAISSGTTWRDFTRAVKQAQARWKGVWPAPANFHPYDLRHSRLTEALRRSQNLQGVQKLARHKRIETTMQYLRALESESMKDVTRAMESAIRPVPSGKGKRRQNRPKRTIQRKAKNRRK